MNEDELKNALHEAVPEGPSPDGWARAARGRAARARGGAAAAVAASLVVVGSLVAVNLPTGGTIGVPASSPAGTAAPAMPAKAVNPDCFGDLTPATRAPTPADGAGVVRASLCPAATGETFAVPADSLTTLAPRLFAAVVKLPWVAPGAACEDAEASPRRYLLVFTSGDGARIVLEAITAEGCPPPADPDATTRWTSLTRDIEGLWQQERAPRTPESATAPCADGHRPSLLSVDPAQLTTGAACGYAFDRGTGWSLERSRPLSAEDLAVLVSDLRERARPGANEDSLPTGRQLSLQSAWGNPLVFWDVGGGQWFALTGRDHQDQLYWEPGGEATATIERAFDAAQPLPPGVSSTEQPPPAAACEAASASSGDIPEGALSLRLCPAGEESLRQFVPLDALDADGAETVLTALRARPAAPADRVCTMELGPAFRLVAGYSGREPVVMDLRLYGCREVGTATDRRLGADEVLDAFRVALAQQRRATPPYAGPVGPVDRTGVLCSRWPQHSVMPFTPGAARIGAVCRFADEAATTPTTQQPIWGDLTLKIAGDLASHSMPWEPRPCPQRPPGQGLLAIALLNGWGDVLSLAPDACAGSYTYRLDGKDYLWTPTEELAKQIEKAAG